MQDLQVRSGIIIDPNPGARQESNLAHRSWRMGKRRTRALLLPRLVSGEVGVSELEIAAGAESNRQ